MNKLKAVWNQRKDVILFGLISLLYSLGGGGSKFLRRYAMPLTIILALKPYKKVWQNICCAALLALPLHYGYTSIVDGLNWPAIAGLGAVMGLCWLPVAKVKTWVTVPIMTVFFCLSVYVNKFCGLDWMWSEYIVGTGYATCYLICKAK